MLKQMTVGLLASASFALVSCEGLVDDINNDPNNFTEVTLPLALGQAGLGTASISNQHTARIATMFSDQFTGTDRQYISINNYAVDASDFDATWEDIYQRALPAAQIAKELATEQGAAVPQGVATIFEAYYFGEAAALFGDVPFTQANQIADFPDPAFEPQADVLRGAVALLDEAIGLVGDVTVTDVLGDVFVGGATWNQVANGLKARYLLLLRDYDGAFAAATAANPDAFTEYLAIPASSANYGENLYWQFEVEQRSDYLSVGNSRFRQLLSDTTDNSRANDKTDDSARYNYFVNANDDSGLIKYNTTDGFAAINEPMYVLTPMEVHLTRAEAALLKSSPDQDAAIASFNIAREFWDEYLGTENYEDYEADDFDDDGIAAVDGEDGDGSLRYRILEEKFLSVIGLPTFYDIGRTDNLLGLTPDVTSASGIPERYLYPSSERASNANLFDADGNAISQPGLFMPTPVNQ